MRTHTGQALAVIDAACALGDAVMTAAVLAGHSVTAISRSPEHVTHFSPSVTYSDAHVDEVESLAAAIAGVDAVVLTLGSPSRDISDQDLAATVARAMRAQQRSRLIVTVPLDCLQSTVTGMRDRTAPRYAVGLRDIAASMPAHRSSRLDTRRALELARLTELDLAVLAHPPVIVAPGPVETSRVPLTHAPTASRNITAANAAARVLDAALEGAETHREFIISE